MSYVDGYVVPVPDTQKEAYLAMAKKAAPVFMEYGALRMVECWGDDVPPGKVTDFQRSVKLEDSESVVFSWVFWPSKAVRDKAMPKLMEDPRMQPDGGMPFDGKRMIYGGFSVIFDQGDDRQAH